MVAMSMGMWSQLLSAAEKKKKLPLAPAAMAVTQVQSEEMKATEALKAQEWIVYLSAFKDAKEKPQVDIVTFSENNKFISKNLFGKGFQEASYTLSLKEGMAVWEVFQENQDGVIAFWRGELKGKVMQGIVSILLKNGTITDLCFTTAAPQEKI